LFRLLSFLVGLSIQWILNAKGRLVGLNQT